MEAETLHVNHPSGVLHQFLPPLSSMLLVSMSYVDPGKLAATVEGGARFGFDLLVLMLLFNLAAILCHYLSARIGVATGRDLGQICSQEYDKSTCMFLGIQAEFSAILLDLTMILGISNGLNLLFGWDLFTCVCLTAVNAALFPIFPTLLENCKAEILFMCMAGLLLLSFVLGVLISQPEIPLSINGMLTKVTGDSAFALMSLLGASIMPHNFYVHSFIVKQHKELPNISKHSLCYNHLVAILCVFSGIYLVNYVLMNSAANVFYSTGLVVVTFQDAMSLLEQVFRSPVGPVGFLLVLFLSNQITSLNWSLGGEVIMLDFLKLDIPGWLHCATIRIVAVIPALYCVWSAGAEGMYQLLIFTQVVVALLLPSSVIPLFRIASSRPVMGDYKVSQFVEFVSLITFIGMLGLKIMFVVEMIFGNSDWASNLRWNTGSIVSVPYLVLLISASASFCFMLWLAATPLKSASAQLDAQLLWNCDTPNTVPDLRTQRDETDVSETRYHGETSDMKQESSQVLGKNLENHSDVPSSNFEFHLPESIMEPDQELHVTSIEESHSDSTYTSSLMHRAEESASTVESVPASALTCKVPKATLLDTRVLEIDSEEPFEKTVEVEGDLQIEKDDDQGENSEPEESVKGVPVNISCQTSEGPGSIRSLSGKSEEGGNSAGSLSRLAGLGRAARRQLTTVLDEFWGQLYDFHGQATHQAKAKKLDVMLWADSNSAASSKKSDLKENPGYFSPLGGRGSDPFITSSLYDSPKQQRMQGSLESPYGVQKGSSSLWSNHMQLLDAYVQNSNLHAHDYGERRYSSVRDLPSSGSWDYQPATVHGYQIASYLDRIAKDNRASANLNDQVKSVVALKSQSFSGVNYREPLSFSLGQKLQNGLGTVQTSSFQNRAVSRNSPSQSERPYYDPSSFGTAESLISSVNTKKYHSLPDIHRDISVSAKSAQWDSPMGFGSSMNRSYEPTLYSDSRSRTQSPLAFDELSPSKAYNDISPSRLCSNLDSGLLWSKHPLERFGLTDKSHVTGSRGVGMLSSVSGEEVDSAVDSEVRLLQSFRHCILKLLKLEGSEWLFRQNDGADEELIDCVAARERFLYEAETREINRVVQMSEPRYFSTDRKADSGMKNEASLANFSISSIPNCGDGCIWKSDLIISFGVWCIHRILDLSLMESRPELWGKYTYVLNRLQGIVDPAFSKPRSPMSPCFCLQIPPAYQQRPSPPPVSNGMLPPASKPGKGKCTTAAMLLDIVKDVEIAISCRKGRSGTAAGDVAFPKGKENLASVLKRYKRRLSNKAVGMEGPASRKVPTSTPYSL